MSWFKGGQPGFGGGQPPQQRSRAASWAARPAAPGAAPGPSAELRYKAQQPASPTTSISRSGRRDAVRRDRTRSRRKLRRRGGRHDVQGFLDRHGDDLRRRLARLADERLHGQADGCRQAPAHRREPFHHAIHPQGTGQGPAWPSRRPIRQDPADAPFPELGPADADLPEGTASSSAPRASPWASPSRRRS